MLNQTIAPKQILVWVIGLIALAFVLIEINLVATAPQLTQAEIYLQVMDDVGHVIEKHIGKTDIELRQRLETENIPAASTFISAEEAENAIKYILEERDELIQAWLQTEKSDKKAFYISARYPTGRILKREWAQSRQGNQIRIVLVRDNIYPQQYHLLTAYPEIR